MKSEQQSPKANALFAVSAKSCLARESVTGHHFLCAHLQNCWQKCFYCAISQSCGITFFPSSLLPPVTMQVASLNPNSCFKNRCVLVWPVLCAEVGVPLQSHTL